HYEDKVLEALKTASRILAEVDADGDALGATVLAWEQATAICALSHLLRGVPASDIEAVVLRFGTEAGMVLRENPYRLMQIPGFSFDKADDFARTVGVDTEDARRVQGAVLWALNHATQSGHLFLKPEDISKVAADLRSEEPVVGDFADAIRVLAADQAVVVEGSFRVYLPEYFQYERVTAARLAQLMSSPATLAVEIEPFLVDFQATSGIDLS